MSPSILLCDDDRAHCDVLAYGLDALGYAVAIARNFKDAVAIASVQEVGGLIVGAHLEDGATLALPAVLGVRRPRLVILATRLGERVAIPIARRVGYQFQLTKVVDATVVHRLMLPSWRRSATTDAG